MAIGGGHGLAATLRAVRTYTDRVTAIVSVADDGGSSGRLRELLHIIPPGDLRKCLIALAEPGSPLATAFEYRFDQEELAGHSLGNLVLAGLMDATGDPVAALDEACRLLGVTGRVLPSTTEPVVLKADAAGGEVTGQVAVNGTDHILPGVAGARRPAGARGGDRRTGRGRPDRPRARAPCSPASWPRWRCPGSGDGINASSAQRVYVCNLRPQDTETAGYDVPMHVAALLAHGVEVDRVVCDSTGIAVGATAGAGASTCPWPRPTASPTTRPDWRRPSPICSDDAPDPPDDLAWTCPARRGATGRSTGTSDGRRSEETTR